MSVNTIRDSLMVVEISGLTISGESHTFYHTKMTLTTTPDNDHRQYSLYTTI